MANEVRVKKVVPYPFEAQVDQAGIKKPIKVQKMTGEGLLVSTGKVLVQVGAHYMVSFHLPVSRHYVEVKVRVMRTFDRAINPKEKIIERMAELRFEGLQEKFRQQIVAFLTAIGQNH